MAERHKVPWLCQAVDLACNAAEKVSIDDQAGVIKDRVFDKPAQLSR